MRFSDFGNLSFAFVDGDVTVAADTIDENNHGLDTGQPIRFTSAAPSPCTVGTTYYAIRTDANTIQVASTSANAVAGTQIDLTGQASGNVTAGTEWVFEGIITGMPL